MKGDTSSGHRKQPSPSFSKTAREWMLSSALYDGIEDEDIRQIEMLLSERGANPNTLLPEYGIAPFHMVVANESTRFAVQATDVCLQHGADPNVRSEDGLTPVHLAAMWGCPEVLQVLLASGGDPWLVDCFDMNAFNYALKEDQEECYEILKACCNSQPKPSSHSKSPYLLNLKRVVLYKNDLQIVYEASPSSLYKSTSTQTSPPVLKDKPKKVSECNFFGNKVSKSSHVSKKSDDVENLNSVSSFSKQTIHNGTSTHKHSSEKKCKTNSSNTYDRSILSSRLKEAIVNHRRNSTTFEYSPSAEDRDESRTTTNPCEENDVRNVSVMSNAVSELIKKLEDTNKLRQSLKVTGSQSDMLQNITQRKKSAQVIGSGSDKDLVSINEHGRSLHSYTGSDFGFKQSNGNTSYNGETSIDPSQPLQQSKIGFVFNSSPNVLTDESSLYTLPENEIGFVLNNSVASSTILLRRNKTAPESDPASPPSIGFILDNLDESTLSGRGSSLFSDIDSDVGSPAQKLDDNNIYTEDESILGQSHRNKNSSSESLDPYVSCTSGNGNTRECSSKEEHFESCLETPPYTGDSACKTNSINSTSRLSFDLDNDKKATPLNGKLVTSTPERLSAGGSVFHFPTEENSESGKKSWVEAVLSSSSDEELYMSISEEYEYTDINEGVVLIEKRYLMNDVKKAKTKIMFSDIKERLGKASPTMIVNMLEEAKGDRKRMEREMNNSLALLHNLIKDQQSLIHKQNKKIDAYAAIVEEVKAKNVELDREVKELVLKLEEREQYSWDNTTEIQGVPDELGEDGVVSDWKKPNGQVRSSASESSDVSTISGSEAAYDTDNLRQGLQAHGFTPGPINGSTKRVYLRKLKRFRRKPEPLPQNGQPAYSPELLGTLNQSCEHKLLEWAHLEDSMSASFACARQPWREGQTKTSFTYLLLDPRIARSLPARALGEPHSQLWADFLQAVFYVGKGKRSRPYSHLYSAVAFWKRQHNTNSKKIQKILEIWTSGQGVVCLHVFLNIIPVEAYTREAAMISALSLASLTNEKVGEFYGSAACWNLRLKRRLGCVLLHRAFKVLLAEGERQLRPADID